jgi:hypothetical protein
MNKPEEIKREMAKLQAKLDELEPWETMSVRELATAVDLSPTTASKFMRGVQVDMATAKALLASGLVKTCPCCGQRKASASLYQKPFRGD